VSEKATTRDRKKLVKIAKVICGDVELAET